MAPEALRGQHGGQSGRLKLEWGIGEDFLLLCQYKVLLLRISAAKMVEWSFGFNVRLTPLSYMAFPGMNILQILSTWSKHEGYSCNLNTMYNNFLRNLKSGFSVPLLSWRSL